MQKKHAMMTIGYGVWRLYLLCLKGCYRTTFSLKSHNCLRESGIVCRLAGRVKKLDAIVFRLVYC